MNILFSTTYYHPYVSGLSLYVKRLARELVKRKYSVDVLCMRHDALLLQEERIDNVFVHRATPLFRLSKGFLSFDFIRQSYALSYPADVIVINLPQFEGAWLALWAKIFQKKLIVIYHSELILPRGGLNRLVQWLVELSNTITLSLADTVVTYTEDFAKHSRLLQKYSNIQTVYPPIPQPTVHTSMVNRLKKKIGNADVVIGVAARLAQEKGIEYLIEAIPMINDTYKVVIAGSLEPVGEEAYRNKILNMVKQYSDKIVFLGNIAEEDMGSFYQCIDILVLPSVNSTETFGMVQVEAMMCGVPVIASNLPGVRIPIQKTGMGIVVPIRDSQKIADAMSTILKNKQTYVKNKEVITKIFSQENTIQFYEELFKN